MTRANQLIPGGSVLRSVVMSCSFYSAAWRERSTCRNRTRRRAAQRPTLPRPLTALRGRGGPARAMVGGVRDDAGKPWAAQRLGTNGVSAPHDPETGHGGGPGCQVCAPWPVRSATNGTSPRGTSHGSSRSALPRSAAPGGFHGESAEVWRRPRAAPAAAPSCGWASRISTRDADSAWRAKVLVGWDVRPPLHSPLATDPTRGNGPSNFRK